MTTVPKEKSPARHFQRARAQGDYQFADAPTLRLRRPTGDRGTDGSNPSPSSGESSELRFGLTCSKGLGSAAIAERSTRDLSAQTQSDDSAHPREGGLGGGIEPIACESFVCF